MKKWSCVAGLMLVLLAAGTAVATKEVDLKKPECAWLGVTYENTNDGCKVTGFMPGGTKPLWKAPLVEELLEVGDVIVEVGGRDVTGAGKNLQDDVELGYFENKRTIKVLDVETGKTSTFVLP